MVKQKRWELDMNNYEKYTFDNVLDFYYEIMEDEPDCMDIVHRTLTNNKMVRVLDIYINDSGNEIVLETVKRKERIKVSNEFKAIQYLSTNVNAEDYEYYEKYYFIEDINIRTLHDAIMMRCQYGV